MSQHGDRIIPNELYQPLAGAWVLFKCAAKTTRGIIFNAIQEQQYFKM